jgi:hypothetical protein
MKLLRDLGFLRALRGLLPSSRGKASLPRTITVPAPLARPTAAIVIELPPRAADAVAARPTRAVRGSLQTQRNKVLLSRQA